MFDITEMKDLDEEQSVSFPAVKFHKSANGTNIFEGKYFRDNVK